MLFWLLLLSSSTLGRVVDVNFKLEPANTLTPVSCLIKLYSSRFDGFGFDRQGGRVTLNLQINSIASAGSSSSNHSIFAGAGHFSLWHKKTKLKYKEYKQARGSSNCQFESLVRKEFVSNVSAVLDFPYPGFFYPVLLDVYGSNLTSVTGTVEFHSDSNGHFSMDECYLLEIFAFFLLLYVGELAYVVRSHFGIIRENRPMPVVMLWLTVLNILHQSIEVASYSIYSQTGRISAGFLATKNVLGYGALFALLFAYFLASFGVGITRAVATRGMLHTSFVIFGLLYAIDLAKIFNRHYPMHEPQSFQFFLPMGFAYMNFRNNVRRYYLDVFYAKAFRKLQGALSQWYFGVFAFYICYWSTMSWRMEWLPVLVFEGFYYISFHRLLLMYFSRADGNHNHRRHNQ